MIRCLLLCGALLAAQVATRPGEDSQAEVRRLVRQLNSAQLAQREAAEAELLRRGPTVLELLPPATMNLPAEIATAAGPHPAKVAAGRRRRRGRCFD